MAAAELIRVPGDRPWANDLNRVIDLVLGNDGQRVQFKGYDGVEKDPNTNATIGSGRYSLVVQNTGANHAQIRNAADNANVLTVTDTAMAVTPAASFANGLASTGSSTFTPAAASDIGISIRREPAASSSWTGGVTAAGGLLFRDLTGTAALEIGPSAGGGFTAYGRVQGKLSVSAICSGALALTTTPTDVAGCAVTLSPGDWAVHGVFDVAIAGAGDIGQAILGTLTTTGGTATIEPPLSTVTISPVQPFRCTVERTWIVRVTATTTAKLQAAKLGGAGTSAIQTSSSIVACNA